MQGVFSLPLQRDMFSAGSPEDHKSVIRNWKISRRVVYGCIELISCPLGRPTSLQGTGVENAKILKPSSFFFI